MIASEVMIYYVQRVSNTPSSNNLSDWHSEVEGGLPLRWNQVAAVVRLTEVLLECRDSYKRSDKLRIKPCHHHSEGKQKAPSYGWPEETECFPDGIGVFQKSGLSCARRSGENFAMLHRI